MLETRERMVAEGAYSGRIDAALCFAARMHDGQRRKGTDVPYIVHPVAVGLILQRFGFGDDVIVAGILHDVIEDTSCDLETLRAKFGDRVAAWVVAVSEPDKSLEWEIRKEQAVARLHHMPFEAKAIVCADKAHNLHTLADAIEGGDPNVWQRLKRGRGPQLTHHRAVVDTLRSIFDHPIADELGRALRRLNAEHRPFGS